MRQLLLWVPPERGREVCVRAEEAGATQTSQIATDAGEESSDLVIVQMPNDRFGDVLDAVEPIEGLRLAFQRDSVVVLEPWKGGVPDQVTDITMRGPLEILVEGLQSLGGWTGFLAYSGVAGAIVWAGLVSNTIFLLTAAMLIAPYAAPAMTTALATVRGDAHLLRRSVGRYLLAVSTTAAVAAVLTLVAGVTEVTHLMVEVANVSAMSVVLPVAAGVAGALSFGQADRTSIAAGAGVGMLVALALAPQAGLLGMALVLGEPRILASAAFVAVLQLLGINLAASVVFLLLGVRRRVPLVRPGTRVVGVLSIVVTLVLAGGMIALQWTTHPELTRETVITRAEAAVMAVLDAHPDVHPIDATARFPLTSAVPSDVLAVEARVVPAAGAPVPDQAELGRVVRERLGDELSGIELHVGVTIAGTD